MVAEAEPEGGSTHPPEMRPWNLALRFGLELAALSGLGLAAWSRTGGVARGIAVVAAPVAAATLWGTFNVPGDPSRSGRAPVAVSGRVRLGVEMLVLAGGGVGFVVAGHPLVGAGFAALTVLHYAEGRARVRWLLGR